MATTIDNLSAADRAEFTKRLSVYGLDHSAIVQPDLVVPAHTTMTLSASNPRSFARPHMLTTNSIDQLKSWIGVPDHLFAAGHLDRSLIHLPTAAPPVLAAEHVAAARTIESTTELAARTVEPTAALEAVTAPTATLSVARTLTAAHLNNIRAATSAFLFGDSSLVANYKDWIGRLYPSMQIIFWPFFTITVNAGSVLTIGPGQNVLCAWTIIIHAGGMVNAPYGNLKVDSVSLQKVSP
jgi:hypothetical protein